MYGTNLPTRITADCLVQTVVENHRQTVVIFAHHGLQCVGCYISPFHTIADSAREHAMHVERLLADLNEVLIVEHT